MDERETEKLISFYGSMNLSTNSSLNEMKQFNRSADTYLQDKLKYIKDQEIDVAVKTKRFFDLKNKYLVKRHNFMKERQEMKGNIDEGLMNYTLNRAFAFDQQGGGNIPSEEIIIQPVAAEKGGKSLRYMMYLKDSNGATVAYTVSYSADSAELEAVYAEKEGVLTKCTREELDGLVRNLNSFLKESYPFGIKWLIVGDVEKYWKSLNQSSNQEFSYII
jgi:hypothetical protein